MFANICLFVARDIVVVRIGAVGTRVALVAILVVIVAQLSGRLSHLPLFAPLLNEQLSKII
jgi:hypothetical protein